MLTCPGGDYAGDTMRTIIGTLALLAGISLAGCADDGPDLAACEEAMRQQLATGIEQGDAAPEGTKPAECEGVSDADLEAIGGRVIREAFEQGLSDTFASAFPSEEPADSGDQYVERQPSAIAESLGCTGYADTESDELGVVAAGTCTYEGEGIRILTFATEAARDEFVAMAEGFDLHYVKRPGFVVEAESAEVADVVNDFV